MRRALVAFPALLRVGVAELVAYRSEMVIWVLSATLPLVMLQLWRAASEAGAVGGYDQGDFVRYFFVTLLVRHLTSVWLVWELNNLIRTGELSPWLLRPVSFLWWQFAETLAAWPLRLVVLGPLMGILLWIWPEAMPSFVWQNWALGFLSILLGLIVQFLIQCCIGLLAFWVDQTLGIMQAWFAVWALLGGYMVPYSLLPAGVQTLAFWLPFRATLGVPIEIILGADPWPLLAYQAGWLVILAGITTKFWQVGIRRYGALGA
jgi:ABC-2 type transport system permease protein